MQQSYTMTHKEDSTIIVEKNSLSRLDTLVSKYNNTGYIVLFDNTTEKLFKKDILNKLSKNVKTVSFYVIKEGEKTKNIDTVSEIIAFMLSLGLDRKSGLIAIGGGVVGDIATTVAALYYRGIDCIQIPTTLLAQVDASIGGKGAINIGNHKNTAGVIKQPKLIIVDTNTLKHLPNEQITSGMGEIIKYAIAMDRDLFSLLEKNENIQSNLEEIIDRCIQLKMQVVQEDPEDLTGKRAVLNFGHTIGHAVELLTSLSHGKAVSIGMAFAIKASENMGILNARESERAIDMLKKHNLPTKVSGLSKNDVLKQIKKDKKTIGGVPLFVLLQKIGSAQTNQKVSEEIIEKTLTEVLSV